MGWCRVCWLTGTTVYSTQDPLTPHKAALSLLNMSPTYSNQHPNISFWLTCYFPRDRRAVGLEKNKPLFGLCLCRGKLTKSMEISTSDQFSHQFVTGVDLMLAKTIWELTQCKFAQQIHKHPVTQMTEEIFCHIS